MDTDHSSTITSISDAIAVLASVDWAEVDAASLRQCVRSLELQRNRLAGVSAAALSEWDRRRVWASDQSRTPSARLARDARCSPQTAKSELTRARRLARMPRVLRALVNGDISPDHADLLACGLAERRVEQFVADEAWLVQQCNVLLFSDVAKVISYWCQHADSVGAEADARQLADLSKVFLSRSIGGQIRFDGWLDPIGGNAVLREIGRITRRLRAKDKADGNRRTPAQLRAAALVEMAHRSATMPKNGQRPAPLITVVMGDETFSRLCELGSGTVITPGQVIPMLGAAQIESILFDGPSRPIYAGRRRRFTGALRRAIEARDRHCQHPCGCDAPIDECDVDHILPWAAGGWTTWWNGRLQCPTHNRHPELHDDPPARRPVSGTAGLQMTNGP